MVQVKSGILGLLTYRPEIDGLRALAVVPVILYHADVPYFNGGFIGVDIFFVISGYLITSIILADLESGSFSLRNFYERRARRILPALFIVMLACIPFAWLWLTPSRLDSFGQSIIAANLFVSNILFWSETGYFLPAAETKPLMHTWSLAVEEQYYLLFPLFLLLGWRRFSRNTLYLILTTVGITSFALCLYAAEHYPSANFYLLPTRGWELLLGSLCAIFLKENRHAEWKNGSLAAIGLALICFSVFWIDQSDRHPGWITLLPTIGCTLFILFGTANTLPGKVMGYRPLVVIGLISYSAYLWHFPILVLPEHRLIDSPGVSSTLSALAITLVISVVSWRYLETPFRNKEKVSRRHLIVFCLSSSAVLLLCAGLMVFNDGYPKRTSGTIHYGKLEHEFIANYGLSETCDLQHQCRTREAPETLLWGDSFAMHLAAGLAKHEAALNGLQQITRSQCYPMIGLAVLTGDSKSSHTVDCIQYNQKVVEWLATESSPKQVVLASPFTFSKFELMVNGQQMPYSKELVTEKLKQTIRTLEGMGKKIVVIAPPPQNGKNLGDCLLKSFWFNQSPDLCNFPTDQIADSSIEAYSLLGELESFSTVIKLNRLICSDGLCRVSIDNVPIYRDQGHLSVEGSLLLGEELSLRIADTMSQTMPAADR